MKRMGSAHKGPQNYNKIESNNHKNLNTNDHELNMFATPHSACREFFMNNIFDDFWTLMVIYVERKDFEKDFVRF